MASLSQSQSSETESLLTSVERIAEYTKLPVEEPGVCLPLRCPRICYYNLLIYLL